MNLSLNFYTQWYWKIDLLNLLHFVWLRSDDHAQYEIRAYADVLLDVIRRWVPLTYDAFMDYRVNAASISGPASPSCAACSAAKRSIRNPAAYPAPNGASS